MTDLSNTVICHYRPRPNSQDEMLELIAEHRELLRELELVTDRPEELYVGEDQDRSGPLFVKIFQWADAEASRRAHSHPRVAVIWERMERLCEKRSGGPSMDFPHFHTHSVA